MFAKKRKQNMPVGLETAYGESVDLPRWQAGGHKSQCVMPVPKIFPSRDARPLWLKPGPTDFAQLAQAWAHRSRWFGGCCGVSPAVLAAGRSAAAGGSATAGGAGGRSRA